MRLIESSDVALKCDYSFGDNAGVLHRLAGSFMKPANESNMEFVAFCQQAYKSGTRTMTLFIDNVRLYSRDIKPTFPNDKAWFDKLTNEHDLLKLCASISYMKFIIFTGHEDTAIDAQIHSRIPENVLAIHAVNAISFGGKVHPFPYGLQRVIHGRDQRLRQVARAIDIKTNANMLLYVNHSVNTNAAERSGINELFRNKPWATVQTRIDYEGYLHQIQSHKFMICPMGNAMDCHRNWEVLYQRRVPVMRRHPYLEQLFKGFPVLFVERYADVNEQMLRENEQMYVRAQQLNMERLDLDKVYEKCISNSLHLSMAL